METFLYSIFGYGAAASLIFAIFGGILAATVYLATKYAFVPAITALRGEQTTQQQIYALYVTGAIIGFFAYILYIILAAGAFLYSAFSKKQ